MPESMHTLPTTSQIELKDFHLATRIGTYAPSDTVPEYHALDLTLWIDSDLVLIPEDGMAHVFDYDPLVTEIERLAADGLYDTQERLMTRIVQACAASRCGRAAVLWACVWWWTRRNCNAYETACAESVQGVSHSQVVALSCARRCPSRDNANQSI